MYPEVHKTQIEELVVLYEKQLFTLPVTVYYTHLLLFNTYPVEQVLHKLLPFKLHVEQFAIEVEQLTQVLFVVFNI